MIAIGQVISLVYNDEYVIDKFIKGKFPLLVEYTSYFPLKSKSYSKTDGDHCLYGFYHIWLAAYVHGVTQYRVQINLKWDIVHFHEFCLWFLNSSPLSMLHLVETSFVKYSGSFHTMNTIDWGSFFYIVAISSLTTMI